MCELLYEMLISALHDYIEYSNFHPCSSCKCRYEHLLVNPVRPSCSTKQFCRKYRRGLAKVDSYKSAYQWLFASEEEEQDLLLPLSTVLSYLNIGLSTKQFQDGLISLSSQGSEQLKHWCNETLKVRDTSL